MVRLVGEKLELLQTLKAIAKSNPIISRIAFGVRNAQRAKNEELLQQLVCEAAAEIEQPVFVKVGANDGVTGDPFGDSLLRNRTWKGILIEPVPYCIKRLRAIYHDDSRFMIDQCAVGREEGSTKFFYVSESAKDSIPDLPYWYDQIGSFDRQHILKHLDGKLEPFIVALDVNVEPLFSILKRHRLDDVTLLHIDTEGYDLEVLKSLGLPNVSPLWIMVEHMHLSEEERQEMSSLLASSGYDVCDTGTDFFAMNKQANRRLHWSMRVGSFFNGLSRPPGALSH